MFVEFKSADDLDAKVAVNTAAVADIRESADGTTKISYIGGGADCWVAAKYEKVLKKIGGITSAKEV